MIGSTNLLSESFSSIDSIDTCIFYEPTDFMKIYCKHPDVSFFNFGCFKFIMKILFIKPQLPPVMI